MNYRERLERSRQGNINDIINAENDKSISCEYFATDNIHNPPAGLDLRLSGDKCEGIPYSLITGIKYDSENGIVIKTEAMNVTIKGRDLKRLYQYILLHRVRFVQPNLGGDIKESGLFVKEIIIEELS